MPLLPGFVREAQYASLKPAADAHSVVIDNVQKENLPQLSSFLSCPNVYFEHVRDSSAADGARVVARVDFGEREDAELFAARFDAARFFEGYLRLCVL